MKFDISVTQEDIDSCQHTAFSCPVSRAISRKTGHRVGVTGFSFYLMTENFSEYMLPSEVTNWITRYDRNHHVEPINFTIYIRDNDLL